MIVSPFFLLTAAEPIVGGGLGSTTVKFSVSDAVFAGEPLSETITVAE